MPEHTDAADAVAPLPGQGSFPSADSVVIYVIPSTVTDRKNSRNDQRCAERFPMQINMMRFRPMQGP